MSIITQAQLTSRLGSVTFTMLYDDDKNGTVADPDTNVTNVLTATDNLINEFAAVITAGGKTEAALAIAVYKSYQRRGKNVPVDVQSDYDMWLARLKAYQTRDIEPGYDAVARPTDAFFDDIDSEELDQ